MMSIRSTPQGALIAGIAGLVALAAPLRAAEAERFFENKVRPLLAEHCVKCHGDQKHKGGLRLDSRAAILTGGDQGPALVPGDADKSLLIRAVQQTDSELKMPPAPAERLTKEQIADLTRWVNEGAPWPGAAEAPRPIRHDSVITDQDRAHWAFQPVRRPIVPVVRDAGWVANPIDAFVLAKLEARTLAPRRPASPRELVRRLHYDLTGLPPTPEDVEAFVADPSPRAYEALVDRLLDSPRYGEKWARHWLDLVRFAETNSYERDNPKPNAWRYRDYVIRAFNEDRPYSQFIREQLAGDEMQGAGADGIIATGYYRLGTWQDEPTDKDQERYDGLDDIVATTSQVFLGLTLDCARCHDHKIDPIPQRDYYRFLSFFHNIQHYRNGGPTDELPIFTGAAGAAAAYEDRVAAIEQRQRELQAALSRFEDEFLALYEQVTGKKVDVDSVSKLVRSDGAKLLGQDRYARYSEQWAELLALLKQAPGEQKAPRELALCVTENGPQAAETFVLTRGNPRVRGERVEPGFPEVLDASAPVIPTPPPGAKTSGRRLALANWIASPDNPLTARVMVNRLWQYHFGRGIVRSPNNFGTQGDKPTHPELLEWLAAELVRQGGRMKPLHRLIVTSNAWRQSSSMAAGPMVNPQSVDPANDLFSRFDMRRLTAEEIRDSILSVSGNLSQKMYGPGVYVEIPKEVLAGQQVPGTGWGKSPPSEQARRSIYIHVKRSLLTPLLESFDAAETDRTAAVRFTTTQPTQALTMLNGAFLHQQAEQFADRLRRECGDGTGRQVARALSLAAQRKLTENEVRRGVELIETLRSDDGAASEAALKYFCLVVLNLNEFVYLD